MLVKPSVDIISFLHTCKNAWLCGLFIYKSLRVSHRLATYRKFLDWIISKGLDTIATDFGLDSPVSTCILTVGKVGHCCVDITVPTLVVGPIHTRGL